MAIVCHKGTSSLYLGTRAKEKTKCYRGTPSSKESAFALSQSHLREPSLTFGEILINEIHSAHHLGSFMYHLDHTGILDVTDTRMGE